MSKQRLEAFTDGVVAILITVMVLELRAPVSGELATLGALLPTLLAYLLSFIFVGIYWNSHHHLLQAAPRIDGTVLWANLPVGRPRLHGAPSAAPDARWARLGARPN